MSARRRIVKFRLWPTILGILIGILMGAGAAYAATVYQNSADIPMSVEVGDVPVTYSPGLEVTPTVMNFSVEPGGKSNIVTLTVKNIGDEVLGGIRLAMPDGIYELKFQETSVDGWSYGASSGWEHSFYNLKIEPGDSFTFNIYLRASTDVTPGSYDFTLHVEEI